MHCRYFRTLLGQCTPKQKPDFELFDSTTIFISIDILGQKQENWIKNFIYQS